jgi:hypothetical protein
MNTIFAWKISLADDHRWDLRLGSKGNLPASGLAEIAPLFVTFAQLSICDFPLHDSDLGYVLRS